MSLQFAKELIGSSGFKWLVGLICVIVLFPSVIVLTGLLYLQINTISQLSMSINSLHASTVELKAETTQLKNVISDRCD